MGSGDDQLGIAAGECAHHRLHVLAQCG